MQFYGRSQQAATKILNLFESGRIPAALSPVFVRRHDNVPCRAWSWSNRLLTALADTKDARGFRQWESVGRRVSKGSKAFHILGPCTKRIAVRDDETGEETERVALLGFKSIPVFRSEDTEVVDADRWAAAHKPAEEERAFVDALPLIDVARSWGLDIDTYNGEHAGAHGWYQSGPGKPAIALGVRNASTWAHELIHAADDRRGSLTKGRGQKLDNEVVAELGGAILLTLLGDEHAADYGGCWVYISGYARKHKTQTIAVCEALLTRTCEAVSLVLQTADELAGVGTDAAQGVAA